MKNICFTSVAFNAPYLEQLARLEASIKEIHPEADCMFWREQLPEKSRPFLDSLYGFKPHAIQAAKDKGYKKIIWLDPACIVTGNMKWFLDMAYEYKGVFAVADDTLLCKTTSDQALRYFRTTRESCEQRKEHLVGGSLYAFDFDFDTCNYIFDMWLQSERDGIFGSQVEAASGQITSHRNDESCMAHSMYNFGVSPVPYTKARYDNVPDALVIKKHFK